MVSFNKDRRSWWWWWWNTSLRGFIWPSFSPFFTFSFPFPFPSLFTAAALPFYLFNIYQIIFTHLFLSKTQKKEKKTKGCMRNIYWWWWWYVYIWSPFSWGRVKGEEANCKEEEQREVGWFDSPWESLSMHAHHCHQLSPFIHSLSLSLSSLVTKSTLGYPLYIF